MISGGISEAEHEPLGSDYTLTPSTSTVSPDMNANSFFRLPGIPHEISYVQTLRNMGV